MKKLSLIMNTAIAFAASVFLLAACTQPSGGSGDPDTSGGAPQNSVEQNPTPQDPTPQNPVPQTPPASIYIGTKAPTEAKVVGDIVFNDGSATPYTADLALNDTQKNAAIAVIFYVGTELNSNYDTTTSRTLGVGLKHDKNPLEWCKSSANAYSRDIKTIQCPASGNTGALTFTGDKNGSDNLEQIAAFLGNNDDTATVAKYPAFYFAKNYSTTAKNLGTIYNSGWYLPSVAELYAIWKVKDTVNAASSLCGGSQFSDWYYRSSSQFKSYYDDAYEIYFKNGSYNFNKKDKINPNQRYQCAVREFN